MNWTDYLDLIVLPLWQSIQLLSWIGGRMIRLMAWILSGLMWKAVTNWIDLWVLVVVACLVWAGEDLVHRKQ